MRNRRPLMSTNPKTSHESFVMQEQPNLYHIKAFDEMTRVLLDTDRHVLDGVERRMVDKIRALQPDARRLFVRLVLRRHRWFRVSKLEYKEICCMTAAAEELVGRGMAREPLEEDRGQLVESFTLAELRERVPGSSLSTKATFQDMASVPQLPGSGTNAANAFIDESGPYIRIEPRYRDLIARLELLYFRIPEMTLKCAGFRGWGRYGGTVGSRWVFPNRGAFLAYEEACKMESEIKERPSVEVFEKVRRLWRTQMSDPRYKDGHVTGQYAFYQFTAPWVLTRTLWRHGTTLLASLKEYKEEHNLLVELLSQRVYCLGTRGKWYDRLALLQTHYYPPCSKTALGTCVAGLEDRYTTLSRRLSLQNRVKRLEKQLCVPKNQQRIFIETPESFRQPVWKVVKAKRRREPQTTLVPVPGLVPKPKWCDPFSKTEARRGPAFGVEEYVLNYYEKEGYSGYFCETAIATTLFGLAFWDILTSESSPAPLPTNALENPSSQPAIFELWTDTFYLSHKPAVDQLLSTLTPSTISDRIDCIRQSSERQNPSIIGVHWTKFSADDLKSIARGLGKKGLRALCTPLAQDYAHFSSGFPDLVLFRNTPTTPNPIPITATDATEAEVQVMFVEVKGPGDQLSHTQRLWIDILMNGSIPVEVCRVEEELSPAESRTATPSSPIQHTPPQKRVKRKMRNSFAPLRSRPKHKRTRP